MDVCDTKLFMQPNIRTKKIIIVNAISSRPAIYNASSLNNFPFERQKMWEEVANLANLSVIDTKRIWRSIRTYYSKERKKKTERNEKGYNYEPIWPLYITVDSFLRDHITIGGLQWPDCDILPNEEIGLFPACKDDDAASYISDEDVLKSAAAQYSALEVKPNIAKLRQQTDLVASPYGRFDCSTASTPLELCNGSNLARPGASLSAAVFNGLTNSAPAVVTTGPLGQAPHAPLNYHPKLVADPAIKHAPSTIRHAPHSSSAATAASSMINAVSSKFGDYVAACVDGITDSRAKRLLISDVIALVHDRLDELSTRRNEGAPTTTNPKKSDPATTGVLTLQPPVAAPASNSDAQSV